MFHSASTEWLLCPLDLAAGLENLSLSVVNDGQPEQIVHPSSLLEIK